MNEQQNIVVPAGIISDLPMAAYLSMPAVSASILKAVIARCPKAAWFESWLNTARALDTSKAMDAGTIAHGILLEGSEDGIEVIDPNDHPAEKTGAIPQGWTNKSIKAARDAAREQGKIPILTDDYGTIQAMVIAAHEFIDSLRDTEPAIWQAFQPEGGESEVTMVWDDGGTACRIRPDRISAARDLIIDYKTGGTSSEPNQWGRTQMVRMGYYTSAAFYLRGVNALCGVTPTYVWLTQEQEPPFLCSIVGLDPHAAALGARKIEYALNAWHACMKSNRWPAYPNRVCYPEMPQWEDAGWEERELQNAETHGIEYDTSKLFQKPEREMQ